MFFLRSRRRPQWESALVAVTRGQLGGSYGHAMDKEANPTDIFVDFLQGVGSR